MLALENNTLKASLQNGEELSLDLKPLHVSTAEKIQFTNSGTTQSITFPSYNAANAGDVLMMSNTPGLLELQTIEKDSIQKIGI